MGESEASDAWRLRLSTALADYKRAQANSGRVEKWCRNTRTPMQTPASLTSENEKRWRLALREAVIMYEANTWHAPASGAGGE